MSGSAMLAQFFYGVAMAGDDADEWPTAGNALVDELRTARGRLALIAIETPAGGDDLVRRLSVDIGVEVAHLGLLLADCPQHPSVTEIESACGDATVITDLDLLMWPQMNVEPLQLLAARSRRHPTIGVWPGRVSAGRAIYSAAGRPDHHDIPLRDTVVLRPRSTRFPDEVPFTIERIVP